MLRCLRYSTKLLQRRERGFGSRCASPFASSACEAASGALLFRAVCLPGLQPLVCTLRRLLSLINASMALEVVVRKSSDLPIH
jgi:hypothetical protein